VIGARSSVARWLLGLLALGVASGCASRSPAAKAVPAPTSTAAATGAPVVEPPRASDRGLATSPALARELEQIFSAPVLTTAVVSALVQSLDTGEVLYRLNPDTLVVPASNQKIVTMAVGAARLGWEYRYETRLEGSAPVDAGVLRGDLVVVGSGDPTINVRSGDRLAVFRDWAAKLRARGITRITGRIVGDDDAFDDAEQFGESWSWDDFAYAYAAPVGALQFNENFAELAIRPGAAAGDRASLELRPAGADLVLGDAAVTTGPSGSERDVSLFRFPGRTELQVHGSVPLGTAEVVERVAVNNPTQYFVSVLRDTLRDEGIDVEGAAVDIDEAPDAAALKAPATPREVLLRHLSPPLSEIGKTLMKVSQNLYAETVFRTLSRGSGTAKVEASRTVVADTLRGWGVAPGQFVSADGSGLSRLNFVSAGMITAILRAMARTPALSVPFETTLPIAGRDGTIAGRLKATRAEGNAIAKTGTLRNVRSLSGYVRAADGERLVFSFLVNNFTVPTAAVDRVVDQAVERLATWQR